MVLTARDAQDKWAKHSLQPTGEGVPRWERDAQRVSGGVDRWSRNWVEGLERIGVTRVGQDKPHRYVRGNQEAAAGARYTQGVLKAVKSGKWLSEFLDGVSR